MTKAELQQTILELPAKERQELVEILWESLEPESLPLPEWQRSLLDEQLAALEQHPEEGESWEEVERSLWPDSE